MIDNAKQLNDVQKIIVLDYGSQYNQLIARRIREFGVFSELKSHKISAQEVKDINPIGIVLSGGPNSVYADNAFGIDPDIFELGIPILGICYGMQLLTSKLGGKVVPASEAGNSEYGQSTLRVKTDSKLFKGTPKEQTVLMSHGDAVTEIPESFHLVGDSVDCPYAAIENSEKRIYGIQFHPEVRHSEFGNDILHNFAFDICGAKGDWSMENFIDMQIAAIRQKIGDRKVLLGLSGGVDSSVVGVLLQRAIGDQLTCIFVDHGLLRKGEGDQVMNMLGGKFGLNIIRVDASKRFLDLLAGVDDPEKKRKIIGNEFVYVFDDEASKLKGVDFLAQGTLYTDVIESGTETAQTIKSHHNVGLPEDMQFELIEPLNTLFKDEVRALGTALGMPDEVVWRQPFPGPGLAIRVMGDITPEKLETVRESDAILREEIAKAGLERDIWQYFTVNTGVRSVGVMGDGRTYDYTIAVRAITSIDGMTADFARVPWDVLQKISVRIVNEVDHVNRVVYDITSKPPATVEWE